MNTLDSLKRQQRLWWYALALSFACAIPVTATEGNVKLEFSTVSTGGKYSPRYVLAAWVVDANTNFIKTVCRYGTKRQKYLSTWIGARSGELSVDGVTGATMKSHEVLSVAWDGHDASGKPLPDGNYLLFVEFTDAHQQGPTAVFSVVKGVQPLTKTFPDQKNFKNIKLSYTPASK